MTDIMGPEERSQLMSRIRPENTKPEMLIRKSLHALGYRYSLHRKDLPGKPDIVMPKYGAVIFVHGCFWHAHDCNLFTYPKKNREWWKNKLDGNRKRDRGVIRALQGIGWRVLTVWECSIRGKAKRDFEQLMCEVTEWLRSDTPVMELRGMERKNDC